MIYCVITNKTTTSPSSKKKKKKKLGCVTSSDFAITASLLALLNSSVLSQQQLKIKIPWIRGTWRKNKNTLDSRMTEAPSEKDLNRYQLSHRHVDRAEGSITVLLVCRLILGATPICIVEHHTLIPLVKCAIVLYQTTKQLVLLMICRWSALEL